VCELIALAKASPGKLYYGWSGAGASPHLTMEFCKSQTGTDNVHVPFKGSSLVLPELLGGRIQAMFDTLPGQVAYVKSGKLRGLVITSLKRSPLLPEVPTVAESGVPGFEVTVWYGVCAPTATLQPILAKLNADIIKVLNMPDLRQ
jgi:tripartite-type tricarboxylate transporter receptor subunit TctC